MTLAYVVYNENEVLIGRMVPTTEIIEGMIKTQFLPDGKTAFILGIQDGKDIWDESHGLRLGTIKGLKKSKLPKAPRPVRIRQTLGDASEEIQYPDWNMR